MFNLAVELVRRGGTISLSGVYGGAADPINLLQLFDKQLTLKMGQANVRRWIDDILPLLEGDDDPLGVESFATHHLPLTEAPAAYEMFQKKQDGAFKVVFRPMKVVVTGATGNVGTSVVEALAARRARDRDHRHRPPHADLAAAAHAVGLARRRARRPARRGSRAPTPSSTSRG